MFYQVERDVREILLKIILLLGLVEIIAAKCIFVFSNRAYLDFQAITFLATIMALLLLLSPALKLQTLTTGLNRWFALFQILFWTGYLLIIYPGYFPYDAFTTLQIVLSKRTAFWQSYLYSFISYALSYLNRHLFVVPLLNVTLWLGCLFYTLHLFPIRKLRNFIFALVVSLLPLQIITLPLIFRDILFGSLSCVLVLQFVPFLREPQKKISAVDFLLLIFTLTLACEVRHDGIVYYALFPFLLWHSKNDSLKNKIPIAIAFGGAMIALNLFLAVSESPKTLQKYEFTAILHPLNAIFYDPEASISSQDKEVVSKVIDLTHLQNRYSPLHIVQFYENLDKLPIASDEWLNFKFTYLKLVFNNFSIFLKERSTIFASNFGYLPGAYIFSDELEKPPQSFLQIIPQNKLPRAIPLFHQWRKTIVNCWVHLTSHYQFLIAFTLLNPLLFILIAYFVSRKSAETALLFKLSAVLLIGRSSVLFFVIPEPHLYYFSPLLYLPTLVIIYSQLSPAKKEYSL